MHYMHISQGLGLYKVKPKEMEKIPALILTASLIRNPDTRLQALADELYERYGGSWLIPVSMKQLSPAKEQVYETYSLLLGTPKEILTCSMLWGCWITAVIRRTGSMNAWGLME